MNLDYRGVEIVKEIKQEVEDINEMDIAQVEKQDSYINYENNQDSINIERVAISECGEHGSPTFEYIDVNTTAVKDEIDTLDRGNKFDSYTSINEPCDLLLKRIKEEPIIKNEDLPELTADINNHIKVEKDMFAVAVKVEEQEPETYMDSTKLEVLTEELGIKPESDICDVGNSSDEFDRGAKERIWGKEHGHRKADKGSFICYHCNFIVHNKEDFIYHINVGNCILKRHASHMTEEDPETVKRNPCIHCDAIFKSSRALDDHVVKNHPAFIESVQSKIHQCKYCTYKTTLSSNLARHATKHPEAGCVVKQSPCVHCDAKFKSVRALNEHIIRNHTEYSASISSEIYLCKHCSYKTTLSHRLAKHMTKHPETGCTVEQYLCVHCEATFKNKGSLNDHVVKHHTEFIASVSSKIHQCEQCSYKTTKSSALTRHMKKHAEAGCHVKQYACIHCDATFNSKIALDDHVIKNHKEYVGSVSSKIHSCDYCSFITTISSHFVRHMTKHPETGCSVEESPCVHCDAKFRSKRFFYEHVIRKHAEFSSSIPTTIYQCKHCSYKTTILYRLDKHVTKHSAIGLSNKRSRTDCMHCDAKFKSKTALDDHIIKNHVEFIGSVSSKIHRCEHCSYITIFSSSLAGHMTKHPEAGYSVKQIPCFHCDVTFKKKSALDDHIIKNHEEFIGSVSSKIHQCKHCSYKTTYSCYLAKHMRKHPETRYNAKEYSCICDSKFRSKESLDDHVIKNHEELTGLVSSKVHQCKHCSYKTTKSSLLTRHMGRHTETGGSNRGIPCVHCDTTFKSKIALHDHVIKNHAEHIASVSSKIHHCEHCSYKTTISSHFARHLAKHPWKVESC